MSEVAAHAGAVDECPLRRGLCVADAGYIVDVPVDPFQHRHDPCHAVAVACKLALREAHELIRWTKSTRQQKGQHFARKIRPQMLPPGFWKQPANVVFAESEVRIRRSPYEDLSERIFAGGWMSSVSDKIDRSLVCDASMLAMVCVAL